MQLTDNAEGTSLGIIERAIERTLGFLRSTFNAGEEYRPDRVNFQRSAVEEPKRGDGGYWIGELEADTTLESDYILFLYFLDKDRYRDKIRKLANYIRKHQLPDGSWNIFHGGPGEVSASVKAYFALKIAGHSVNEPHMKKARESILAMGGAEKVNSFTKIYLTFLNQFDWEEIPAIPPEIILLPRFFYFNVYEISYWSRTILIPLSILYAKKPNSGRAPDVNINEIFQKTKETNGVDALAGHSNGTAIPEATGTHGDIEDSSFKRFLSTIPKDPNLLSWRNFFHLVDHILRLVEKAPFKPFRKFALKKAENWVVSRTQDSDGLGAIFPSMVNSVMAMRCLGHDETHPCVATNLNKLQELEIEEDDCIRLQPCLSPVWDTALVVNAMVEAGTPMDSSRVVEACRWLLTKEVRKPGDWVVRVRNVEVSGWPFQFRNEFYPDVDDTAAVLLALDRCDHSQVDGLEESVNRGLNWVLSMQCSNGGWAAFDVDIDHEPLSHVPYADHNAMLDPACADITGRVVEMLSRFANLRNDESYETAIRRGVEFLKNSQEADGSWYGRWGVNYVYGTWQTLKGLIAAGEDPHQPYIRKAVEWLKEHQNSDGGWGETCDSYRDPKLKGQGVSTASQTAWAVMGLVAAGEKSAPEVNRGLAFLLSTQKEDGSWDEQEFTGTGFPDVFYLRYHLYRNVFPLFALGYYRNAQLGQEAPRDDQKRVRRPTRGLRSR